MRNILPHLVPPAVPCSWDRMPAQTKAEAHRFLARLLDRLQAQGLPIYTTTEDSKP